MKNVCAAANQIEPARPDYVSIVPDNTMFYFLFNESFLSIIRSYLNNFVYKAEQHPECKFLILLHKPFNLEVYYKLLFPEIAFADFFFYVRRKHGLTWYKYSNI